MSHLDDWELVPASGHADGQLCLLKDGVPFAADHLLGKITPTVGLWPAIRADPLGDYLVALEPDDRARPIRRPAGSRGVVDEPRDRAREPQEHHRVRIEETQAALGEDPRTGFELSLALFGDDLTPAARRFAVAESLSQVERLVRPGMATRHEDGGGFPILLRDSSGRRASA